MWCVVHGHLMHVQRPYDACSVVMPGSISFSCSAQLGNVAAWYHVQQWRSLAACQWWYRSCSDSIVVAVVELLWSGCLC